MNLIELKCKKCGADLQVNSELNEIVCNFCGTKMLIDDAATEYARLENAKLVAKQSEHEQEMKKLEDYENYYDFCEDKDKRKRYARTAGSALIIPFLSVMLFSTSFIQTALSIFQAMIFIFDILLCKAIIKGNINKHYKLFFFIGFILTFTWFINF